MCGRNRVHIASSRNVRPIAPPPPSRRPRLTSIANGFSHSTALPPAMRRSVASWWPGAAARCRRRRRPGRRTGPRRTRAGAGCRTRRRTRRPVSCDARAHCDERRAGDGAQVAGESAGDAAGGQQAPADRCGHAADECEVVMSASLPQPHQRPSPQQDGAAEHSGPRPARPARTRCAGRVSGEHASGGEGGQLGRDAMPPSSAATRPRSPVAARPITSDAERDVEHAVADAGDEAERQQHRDRRHDAQPGQAEAEQHGRADEHRAASAAAGQPSAQQRAGEHARPRSVAADNPYHDGARVQYLADEEHVDDVDHRAEQDEQPSRTNSGRSSASARTIAKPPRDVVPGAEAGGWPQGAGPASSSAAHRDGKEARGVDQQRHPRAVGAGQQAADRRRRDAGRRRRHLRVSPRARAKRVAGWRSSAAAPARWRR